MRPIIPGAHLGRFIPTIITLVVIAALPTILARIRYPTRIPIVAVDPTDNASVARNNIVENQVARTPVVAAVAAAAAHLAVVLRVEVLDADGAEAVELDDLVSGGEGPAAVDVGGAAGLFEGAGRVRRRVGCGFGVLTWRLRRRLATRRY